MSDNPSWEFHPGSSRAVCGYLYAVGTIYAMVQWYVRSKMERTCSDQISKLNSTPVTASLLTFVRVISASLLLRTVWLFVAAAAPLEYLCTGSTGQAEYCDTVYVVPVARLSQFLFYVAFTIIVSFWTQWSAGPHPDPLPSYVSRCATFFVVANVWMFMLQAVATALLMYVAQVDVMEKQAPSLMVRKLLVAYEGVQAGTFLGLAVALFVSGYWLRKYLISLVTEYEERSLRLGMQHRLAIGAVRIPNPLSATVNHVTQAYEADLERTGADSRATGSTSVLQSSAVKLTASALVVVALFVLRAALLAIMAADAMNMGTNTSNFVIETQLAEFLFIWCMYPITELLPALIFLVLVSPRPAGGLFRKWTGHHHVQVMGQSVKFLKDDDGFEDVENNFESHLESPLLDEDVDAMRRACRTDIPEQDDAMSVQLSLRSTQSFEI